MPWTLSSPTVILNAQGAYFRLLIFIFHTFIICLVSFTSLYGSCPTCFCRFESDSMAGKQVHEIPPANIGGTFSCISIGARGMDLQKVCKSPC